MLQVPPLVLVSTCIFALVGGLDRCGTSELSYSLTTSALLKLKLVYNYESDLVWLE